MTKIRYYKNAQDMTGIQTNIVTRLEIQNGITKIFEHDRLVYASIQPVYILDGESQVKVEENKVIILFYRDK